MERLDSPSGGYETYQYDKLGNETVSAVYSPGDALLAQVERVWAASSTLQEVRTTVFENGQSRGETEAFEWDRIGRLRAYVDRSGSRWEYEYGMVGGVIKTTDPLGNYTSFTRDRDGMTTRAVRTEVEAGAPVPYATDFAYDDLRRLTRIEEVDQTDPTRVLLTTFKYDSRGNQVEMVNAHGISARSIFDARGLVTKVTRDVVDSQGVKTGEIDVEYGYDVDGNLALKRDDAGNTTVYTHDSKGQVTMVQHPDGTLHQWTYDSAGNPVTVSDPNGTVVTSSYDALHRLTNRTIARGPGVLGTTTETYSYDDLGNLSAASDDDTRVELTHDSEGNVLLDRQGPALYDGSEVSVGSAWDAAQRLTALTLPSGAQLTYARDALGRAVTVHEVGVGIRASWNWTGSARIASRSYLNGTTTTSSHGGFRRLSGVSHDSGSAPWQGYEYARDDLHRIAYEKRLHAGGTGDVYHYDSADRLVSTLRGVVNPVAEVATPGSQSFVDQISFTLDDVGNRSAVAVTPYGGSSATTTYSNNNLNTYTSVGTTTRTHDANSNLTDNGTLLFAYDYRGQLVEVRNKASGAVVAAYNYDALGRRTQKMTSGGAKRFVYFGNAIVEERSPANAMTAYYVLADAIDDRVSMTRQDSMDYDGDGNTLEFLDFYYHEKLNGTVSAVTDSVGGVAEQYTYDEFGALSVLTGTGSTLPGGTAIGNRFGFQGREYDAESGLYHYRARAYDPTTGAFLQPDPLGFIDSMKLSAFVRHDPVNLSDPLGLTVKWRCPSNVSDEECERRKREFLKQLNRDLHGSKGKRHKDKEFGVDDDGNIKLYYISGKKKGQEVKAKGSGLKGGMKKLVGYLGDETETTIWLVGNADTFAPYSPEDVGRVEEIGVSWAQRGANGDVYVNVDARAQYNAVRDKKGFDGEDPLNTVALLYHEAAEHRFGDEYREKNPGATRDEVYDHAHDKASRLEALLRHGEGMQVPNPRGHGGWVSEPGLSPGRELPATLKTSWIDMDSRSSYEMDVEHARNGGVEDVVITR